MYRTFFGFREKPFNLTPDPKFLYLNASYREALAALHYGIKERKGFVALIGEAGTGKTTLLRRLLSELGPEMRSVLVLNPSVGFDDLLGFILTDLGRPPTAGTPKLELLETLNAELLDTLARGGNVVVLIDEAQDLGIGVLEELRLLSNLETAKEKILQFVLAGQPELDAMLERPELRQLRQRIAVFARLRPLLRRELDAYVSARIEAAGGSARDLFSRPALYRLWRFSRGVPRLVNVAGDNALVTAYAAGRKQVGWRAVGEAVSDLRPVRFRRASRRYRVGLGVVGLAAAIGIAVGLAVSQFAAPARTPDSRVESTSPPDTRAQSGGGQPSSGSAPAEVGAAPVANAPTDRALVDSRAVPTAADSPEAGDANPLANVDRAHTSSLPVGAVAAPPPNIEMPAADRAAKRAVTAERRDNARARKRARRDESASRSGSSRQNVDAVRVDRVDVPATDGPPLERAVERTDTAPGESLKPVRIEPGDTLTHIVRRYYGRESPTLIAAIRKANPTIADPDVVLAGQTVLLPGLQNGDQRERTGPKAAREHAPELGEARP